MSKRQVLEVLQKMVGMDMGKTVIVEEEHEANGQQLLKMFCYQPGHFLGSLQNRKDSKR